KENGGTVPAGTTLGFQIGVIFYSNAGTVIGSARKQTRTGTGGVFAFQQAAVQVAATYSGQVPAYARAFVNMFWQNPTGSPVTNTAGDFDFYFDDIKFVIQNTAFDVTPINTAGTSTTTTAICNQ